MDYNGTEDFKKAAATVTCITALVLLVTFFIALTRFRLWHSNRFLEMVLKLVDNPLTHIVSFSTTLITTAQYRNDLYMIWLVVLIIAYDNVVTISAGSAPSTTWLLREYAQCFLALYSGYSIIRRGAVVGFNTKYLILLLVLWLFVLVKFSLRLVFHKRVDRAYGLTNSKLVADYMKVEHEQSGHNETVDPTTMKGYKYLVLGEWNIKAKIKGPEYTTRVDLPSDVVTVERVWSCKERLLHPSIDRDQGLKDVSLSFALFKLLKRRFFEYPAAEAQQEKTRKFVFDGLLARETNDIYRVIGIEICFLRDFFYTRYPVIFASGFPVFQLIVLTGILGLSLAISVIAFHYRHTDSENNYLRSKQKHHNIDYTITNVLLMIIVVMETLETMFYVFSDWTKVMLICGHVKSQVLHPHCFLDKVLALLCKGHFSLTLNNSIGQYSLLKLYRKTMNSSSTSEWTPLVEAAKGMKRDTQVPLSPDVKEVITSSLRMTNGNLTNGVSSLMMNGVYGDLAWTCTLKSEYHTLLVWHIATALCGIHPIKKGGDGESIKPYHLVATHLSNYCTYLMVFLPDMLPQSSVLLKLFFREILSETKEFFQEGSNDGDVYGLMMRFDGSGDRVIDMGVKLGRYLMEINDDAKRWKIMADFWTEFIIFLAPSGKPGAHMKKLKSGGEFITHLWALLYHAGIGDSHRTTTATNGQQYP